MDLIRQIWEEHLNFEYSIYEKNIKDIPEEFFPHGFLIARNSGREAYMYHRHMYTRFLLKKYKSSKMYDEVEVLQHDLEDSSSGKVIIEYLQTADELDKLGFKMQNLHNQFKNIEKTSEQIELSPNLFSYYVLKYEVVEYLMFLVLVTECVKKSTVDLSFQKFKDNRGNFKRGVMIDYISNGLGEYPEFKLNFDKAYRPKLRNSIGHNNYKYSNVKYEDLDGKICLTYDEVAETIYALQEVQALVFNLMCILSINNINFSNCGVSAVRYEVTPFKKPILNLYQLWSFYDIDNNHIWTKNLNVSFNKRKVFLRDGAKLLLQGQLYSEIKDFIRIASSQQKVTLNLMSIIPRIDEDSVPLKIRQKEYQIQKGSYINDIEIKIGSKYSK